MHSVTIHSHSAQHVFQGMVLMLLNYASHVRLAVHNAQPAHQHVLCVMQVIMRILVPVMLVNLDAPVVLIALCVHILHSVQLVLIHIEYTILMGLVIASRVSLKMVNAYNALSTRTTVQIA